MLIQSLPISFFNHDADDHQKANFQLWQFRELVTPQLLVAYGIMANALFWSGLTLPYNANSAPEVAYLHGFVAVLGIALALGGATATLMIVSRRVSVPIRSLEFVAGLLNISVLTATGCLLMSALIRGM